MEHRCNILFYVQTSICTYSMSHPCFSFPLTQPLIPPQNPRPLPMQAAGIFYSPQWITNDPVSPCAAFTFRLAQVLLTWFLFPNSMHLQLIDYQPLGSLHKTAQLKTWWDFLRQPACGEKRSISSFAGKNTNDVTRDVPQPTDMGTNYF